MAVQAGRQAQVGVHLWQSAADGSMLPWADHELRMDPEAVPERMQLTDPETKASLAGWRRKLQVGSPMQLTMMHVLHPGAKTASGKCACSSACMPLMLCC